MTIDEAIKHCLEVVEKNEQAKKDGNLWIDTEYEDCCADHRQLADWLKELRDRQWISVDERLPKNCNSVLVWYSTSTLFIRAEGYGISWYSQANGWYKNKLEGEDICVKYWQPLPESPKED